MKQKIALVTGASRGIGLAVAECLKKQGVKVLAPARQELDLLSESSIDSYLAGLKQPVDILVNNAGVNILGCLEELDDKVIEEMVQIDLLAPLRVVRPTCSRDGETKIRQNR